MPRHEKIKVLIGTPKEVEKKLNDYFRGNDHPNATIIATTVNVHTYQIVDEDELERRKKQAEKEAKKPKEKPVADKASEENSGTPPPAEPPQTAVAVLEPLPMKLVTVETMAATVGLVFP